MATRVDKLDGPPAVEPAALTYADVAGLLKVSPKTITRLPVPGRLVVGRSVRFDKNRVLAWIAAGCPSG